MLLSPCSPWLVLHEHSSENRDKLRQDEALLSLPQRLREVLRLPEFRTKRLRMGKIISVTTEGIHVYQ